MEASAPLHASCIAWEDRGLLILGPSGSGKSALALEMMAWGCTLVADDRVILRREGRQVMASAPPPIRGLIEARGIGLLEAEAREEVPLAVLLDLGTAEKDRLPPWRERELLGVALPCLHKPASGPIAPALLQYLKFHRREPASPRIP